MYFIVMFLNTTDKKKKNRPSILTPKSRKQFHDIKKIATLQNESLVKNL